MRKGEGKMKSRNGREGEKETERKREGKGVIRGKERRV
jgi:hypothetical protein